MTGRVVRHIPRLMLVWALACPGLAAAGDPVPAAAPAQAPATNTSTLPKATTSQTVALPAGTGVLLQLSQPITTVLSADPDTARVEPASPTTLFLMGVAPGVTTVVATNAAGAAIAQYTVRVTAGTRRAGGGGSPGATQDPVDKPVSAAQAAVAEASIAQSVAGAQDVTVTPVGGKALLRGSVPTASAAQQVEAIARAVIGGKSRVIDALSVLGSLQVNVRVRFAEIDRTITRQLGFNWQALANGSAFRFGLQTGAAALGPISALLPLNLPPQPNAPSPNQVGGGYASGNGLWDINGVIDALAADQLITILAEPNLTAQSGEAASFLAGGEFPVPIAGSTTNGSVQITVEFKQFGVSLTVVPTVLSPTRLNLRIRPEVSQLTTNGAVNLPLSGGTLTIPALTVRRAETTVELGSGQSFAIAGLLEHTSTQNGDTLPGVGEIPVLGALFRSNAFQRGESELVIIVTPYIVRPVSSPAELHAPTDHYSDATDLGRILYGRQVPLTPAAADTDAGFILP